MNVSLYFLYPTLVQTAAELNKCDTYDFGYGPRRFLSSDYSIDCDGPEYSFNRIVSIIFIAGYGLGIPLMFRLAGRFVNYFGGVELEMGTFAFLMGGFRTEHRYWEAINMMKKMVLIFLVTYVPQPSFRAYTVMWVLLIFTLYSYASQPTKFKIANQLETLTAIVLSLSVVLSLPTSILLSGWNEGMAGTSEYPIWLSWPLAIVFATMNGFLILFYVLALGREMRMQLAPWLLELMGKRGKGRQGLVSRMASRLNVSELPQRAPREEPSAEQSTAQVECSVVAREEPSQKSLEMVNVDASVAANQITFTLPGSTTTATELQQTDQPDEIQGKCTHLSLQEEPLPSAQDFLAHYQMPAAPSPDPIQGQVPPHHSSSAFILPTSQAAQQKPRVSQSSKQLRGQSEAKCRIMSHRESRSLFLPFAPLVSLPLSCCAVLLDQPRCFGWKAFAPPWIPNLAHFDFDAPGCSVIHL